jgi:hypothetical protein
MDGLSGCIAGRARAAHASVLDDAQRMRHTQPNDKKFWGQNDA